MEEEPWNIGFFQMVRILERLHPDRKPVGIFVPPGDEVVRFSAPPDLTFPPSEIRSFVESVSGPACMDVSFMGLNTVNGPMPRSYTEGLLERAREGDQATLDFFDLFNHRLISLFYRAWKKYRFFLAYEESADGSDGMTGRLYSLIGLGTPALNNRMAIADEAALHYAGLLAHRVRSVEGLRQILTHYFGIRVEIAQFSGAWVKLPLEQRTTLDEGENFSDSLGVGTVVGDEVWDQQGAMTVRLGPMSIDRYRDFLPGSKGYWELEAWLRLYSRQEFDFTIRLLLARDEVPATVLATGFGEAAGVGQGNRLGYESWLKVKPMNRDPDETTYVLG
ncbi:type VI secretion system baseplate subunit TssG [Terriglobus saanensis]|nr:type VI secretion system baseplate subunit TssG [Terriglobus saanensis]